MPTIYATMADLRAWLGLAPEAPDPTNGTRYLRSASSLVSDAILAAVYQADDAGVPTDTTQSNACRDATLYQAEAWIASGIDPALGVAQIKRSVKSKSASGGGLSVTYDDADARSMLLALGRELVPEAMSELRRAGMLTTAIQSAGAPRDTYLVGTEYRLTTGEIVP